MLQALSNHSPLKGQHTVEVMALTNQLLNVLNASENVKTIIRETAELHNIGWITFTAEFCEFTGRYSDEQFQLMRTYPEAGAEYLKAKGVSTDVIEAVRYHAHNYDPNLPLAAKVIRFTRDFRKVLEMKDRFPTMKDALQDMQNMSGKAYDPAICEAAWIAFDE